ncbi:tripartite motif-containing protein 16-like [Acanthopagrus latus]|uniref:tripartite motif-containing protein 16-like n=1 Tax=Acanthopagrus latus TaxID=8177 RepID=UPI00187C2353|nr:tripartite motif-containing protein 16-like [Acanthopagrus latus]
MAQRGTEQEKLHCSICLDLLKDPVTIPCGHSFCMNCVRSYWEEQDQKKICSCPQCRQTFQPSPALMKNTMLADLVEELKKTGLQAAPADHCYAGPEDVACDFCTGRKLKAVKSCLQCLVSYCEQHLRPHYDSPAFEKHKLVDPSKKLQENICTRHSEVMKIFCRTDQQCICYLCSMDEHKGHDTVSVASEMTEKKKELEVSRQKIQQRIQDREKDMKLLQQEVEAVNGSADKAVRDSEKILTDMKQQIRSRQKTEVTHISKLQEKVEQEIADLKRKDADLEQLLHLGDQTQFLNNYTLLPRLSEASDSLSINTRSQSHTEGATAAVSEVRDKLQAILSDVWSKTSLTEAGVDILLPQSEPKTRSEFLQYSRQLTLDPNTAHDCLSCKSSRAHHNHYGVCHRPGFPQHPDRFISWSQVLCREHLSGRCYWEVEWSGCEVFVAVAYKDISREGRESVFGNNVKSWALQCFSDSFEFRHNNIRTSISGPPSSTIGVYLDHHAGILSFYSISDTMTLLHRVQTTFTQPLCPGLGLFYNRAYAGMWGDMED